jgi:hypothetical protein
MLMLHNYMIVDKPSEVVTLPTVALALGAKKCMLLHAATVAAAAAAVPSYCCLCMCV